jgi:hypothetical protein
MKLDREQEKVVTCLMRNFSLALLVHIIVTCQEQKRTYKVWGGGVINTLWRVEPDFVRGKKNKWWTSQHKMWIKLLRNKKIVVDIIIIIVVVLLVTYVIH